MAEGNDDLRRVKLKSEELEVMLRRVGGGEGEGGGVVRASGKTYSLLSPLPLCLLVSLKESVKQIIVKITIIIREQREEPKQTSG